MKSKYKAFTLVELLVVIGIIALLSAILLPTMNLAMKHSRATTVKASFNAISMGLEAFRNDQDKYPSSEPDYSLGAIDTATNYHAGGAIDNGCHYLVEALCGIDLLGYSTAVPAGGYRWYDIKSATNEPIDWTGNPIKRYGPYVDVTNFTNTDSLVNFRQLRDSDAANGTNTLLEMQNKLNYSADACRNMNPIFVSTIEKKAPRPILYYKANTRGRYISSVDRNQNPDAIYFYDDNAIITDIYNMVPGGNYSNQYNDTTLKSFSNYIWNTDTSGTINAPLARPYNLDSYILASAGIDGEFGTEDDITNFSRK